MVSTQRPPRVIHVFNTLNSGGLQRVVLSLTEWSGRTAGVESLLVSQGGTLESQLPQTGGHWIKKETKWGVASEVLQLRRLVKDFHPDVLHAHQRRDALVCHIVGSMTGVPVLEHAHNTLPDLGQRALSFRSRTIFAVSDEVKKMIVDVFGRDPERVLVVGGAPFNTSTAPPPPRHSPANGGERVILGIGRLEEQKDPERFVRVIAEAARQGRHIRGRWLGSGTLESQCMLLAESLGAPIDFVGECSDVVGELDRSHGMLITSRWEGLGLVILEAFARQRPVVGLRVGGMGSLLAGGRGSALPASIGDDELAAALWEHTGFSANVDESVAAAAAYVRAHATPEAVFGPIVNAYRKQTRRA